MAYKYNSVTGRVSSASPVSAYNPSGLTQTTIIEAPPLEWAQKQTKPKLQSHMGGDGFLGKLIRNRVYENQARLVIPDGAPVHLKLGARDRITFMFAMGLTIAGTVWSCYSLIELSKAKK